LAHGKPWIIKGTGGALKQEGAEVLFRLEMSSPKKEARTAVRLPSPADQPNQLLDT
jgi:hypothetical protein